MVTKIRIRATTIRNWDRKEFLVPNKEFITGRLLNWSLSDQVTRLMVVIGVAYGSDVEQAHALMREAALEHPRVLDDPKPALSFEGFGDNALTLILRAYIDTREPLRVSHRRGAASIGAGNAPRAAPGSAQGRQSGSIIVPWPSTIRPTSSYSPIRMFSNGHDAWTAKNQPGRSARTGFAEQLRRWQPQNLPCVRSRGTRKESSVTRRR